MAASALYGILNFSMEVAMADRPTDSAKANFRIAKDTYRRAVQGDAKDFQLFTTAATYECAMA
jgi:hypothetical protein